MKKKYIFLLSSFLSAIVILIFVKVFFFQDGRYFYSKPFLLDTRTGKMWIASSRTLKRITFEKPIKENRYIRNLKKMPVVTNPQISKNKKRTPADESFEKDIKEILGIENSTTESPK